MDKTTDPISVSEASELLGVSRRHITRLILKGEFTWYYKNAGVRGAYLLDRNEVKAKAGKK